MIARLSGTLIDKHPQRLVIDVAGVGYEVHVPLTTLYAAGEVGGSVALRIHTHVREDALLLFGFASVLEHQMFERLIGVSGIGPKLALAVLSGIEGADLVAAIRRSDVARLVKVPGIGRKTAERLVIELRDRLPDAAPVLDPTAAAETPLRDDILSALEHLGYQRSAVEKTVDRVLGGGATDLESALREILRQLVRT